jgi:SAM-dependent methyltransferase
MDYKEKIGKEREWYTQTVQKNRLWHNPFFYSMERILFNYEFPRVQLADLIHSHCPNGSTLLAAPCGAGDDVKYLNDHSSNTIGIDISHDALRNHTNRFMKIQCDVKDLCFLPETFDCVLSSLFLHHYPEEYYSEFLSAIYHVTKPGGRVFIMEPSMYYPLNVLTRPIKYLFNNPYGEVDDEGPVNPRKIVRALRTSGFEEVQVRTATFSHCSFFHPLANTVNFLTKPLLRLFPFSYCGWFVIVSGRRPGEAQ